MSNIGIIGAGTWGLALADVLSKKGHIVTIWSAIDREINELLKTRKHPNLSGLTLSDEVRFTTSKKEVCQNKDILLFAVPSVFVRQTTAVLRDYISEDQLIVDVAKGIEDTSLLMMSEVIKDELSQNGTHQHVKIVALSGPTHAEEVAVGLPTTIVASHPDENVAQKVQDSFMTDTLRVYTNRDILGVELSGALKNIIALASGISDGLGYGDNARAALITRGMTEIKRLGLEMGGMPDSFDGLAGIGDLIVTATSVHSRNHRAGQLIGQGYSVQEALESVSMVVEGVNVLPAAIKLAKKFQVEMPLISGVDLIINHGADPKKIVNNLMNRDKKSEHMN